MNHRNNSKVCAQWRRDNACTLNGSPAKIVGWTNTFATIASLDGTYAYEWAWDTVARIMAKDRAFRA